MHGIDVTGGTAQIDLIIGQSGGELGELGGDTADEAEELAQGGPLGVPGAVGPLVGGEAGGGEDRRDVPRTRDRGAADRPPPIAAIPSARG